MWLSSEAGPRSMVGTPQVSSACSADTCRLRGGCHTLLGPHFLGILLENPSPTESCSHQVRSHSTAWPGQEMDTCPNVAERSWLQVWMDIKACSTLSKPLQSQNQLGSDAIYKPTSFGNQEIISKRVILLLFQLQRRE